MATEQTEETAAGGKKSKSGAGTRPAAKVEHFTPDERAARGKAARAEVPRSSHAEWEPPPHRPDPVELLEEQAQTRVPELVPIRYGRMLVSPFTFYRGAAYLMASDLAGGPRTGPAHPALRRRPPVELRRLRGARPAARLRAQRLRRDAPRAVRVGRQAPGRELRGRRPRPRLRRRRPARRSTPGSAAPTARRCASSRRCGNLDIWYARVDIEDTLREFAARATGEQRKRLEKNVEKTRTKDSLKAFAKLTEVVDGEPRIISDPPLLVPIAELAGGRRRATSTNRSGA